MRSLAIARLRLLTRIRTASPMFALATVPALLGIVMVGSVWLSENEFRASAPLIVAVIVPFSIMVFVFHTGVLLIGSETAQQLHPQREGAEWSDLMETIPLGPSGRFWGEVLGNLAVNLTVHLCTLPLLALVAALSPLPIQVFLALEAVTLLLLWMSAGAAAWKRCARPTKWSGTRMARSGLLFWILFVLILRATSRWDAFLDAIKAALEQPRRGTWSTITATISHPTQLTILVALLCMSFVAFYYISSVRGLARRRRT